MNQEVAPTIVWDILQNLKDGVILAAQNGDIHFVNEAAKTLLRLAEKPVSLAVLFQQLDSTGDWRELVTEAAVDFVLETADQQFFQCQTKQLPNGDVQILVSLVQPALKPTEQLEILTEISQEPDFDKKLSLLVKGLQMTGWERVALTLRDPLFRVTQIFTAGFTAAEKANIHNNKLPAEQWRLLFEDKAYQHLRHSSCYFVPAGSNWPVGHRATILPDEHAPGHDKTAWHPQDLLCAPLYNRQKQRIGLIGLDRPQNGRRPTSSDLQTIELYAQFAASIIESVQLFQETLLRSREFELLSEASSQLSSMLDADSLLRFIGKQALRATKGDAFSIFRWQQDSQRFELLVHSANGRLTPTDQQMHHVVQHQRPLLLQQAPNGQTPATTQLILPIFMSSEPYGIIVLKTTHQINERELNLLTMLINQASSNLEAAVVFEEVFEREAFYNALGSVNMALNYTLDLDKVLRLICREGTRIFKVDAAYIWRYDQGCFIGGAAYGLESEGFIGTAVYPTDTNAFVNVLSQNRTIEAINNVAERPDISLRLPHRDKIQAVLGVPLEREGIIIGVLVFVDHNNPYRFSTREKSRAPMFGVQASIALQNATLFAELRLLNEELDSRVAERTRELHEESNRVKILLRISSELTASLDHNRVLNRTLHLVNEVVEATQAVILLIDHEHGELIFRAAHGTKEPPPPEGLPSGLMYNEGLAGWMIKNRQAVLVHDTHQDPRWVQRPTSSEHRSVLAVPLETSNEVIGVMMFFHTDPNAFTLQQLDLLQAAASQAANAINNANLYQLIREQAEGLGEMIRLEQIESSKNQAILQSIADGVLVGDEHNQVILANEPVCDILGIARDELTKKSINELLGLYSTSGRSWLATIEHWAYNADRLSQQKPYLSEQLEIEGKTISILLSPVLVGTQFFGTVSIFRDITTAVELDRLKSEFVSNVSHELRTPMTSIKGYADLMLMGAAGPMSEAQKGYLQIVKNNAQRLQNLVGDLLNISHIETGKTQLDLRPVNLQLLIADVVGNHLQGRIRHEDKPITVSTELPPGLPLVTADPQRITQVLTNLLDNAFNYTAAQGDIAVSAKMDESFVYVAIQDSGIGISNENLSKIFDRFFRAEDEEVQQVAGTGLGLAIVRGLLRMHGGDLFVESERHVGSTFSFNLPIVVEESELA
ncbi:MAG: GAF domain-containing protein [Chloroflexota bacterium]